MTTYLNLPTPASLPTHDLGFSPARDLDVQVNAVAQHWLTSLELACTTKDGAAFRALFAEDGFWRDILAFTSDYRCIRGSNIKQAASDRLGLVQASNFVFSETAPSLSDPFPDVTFLNVHFTFSTKLGPGYGIANLVHQGQDWKAYTVFTILEGIEGHPCRAGAYRFRGTHNDERSYDQRREDEREFRQGEKQPTVIIIGAGHNGLAVAAQLKALGVESLVVDTYKRVGDNWRLRYSSLSLHDPVYANHLPFISFPSTWPIFTPAGKLANFLEHYVDTLELNVWCQARVDPEKTKWNPQTEQWDVVIERSGAIQEQRTFSVQHVILATGLGGGKPKLPPKFDGQDSFKGTVVHSSQHGTAADWKGKRALVVGSCTSGHDICTDFANHGVDVTMLQRSPTYVMSVAKGMPMLVGGLYGENTPPTDLADRIAESNPKHVVKLLHQRIIPKLAQADKDMLDGLAKAGFQTTQGPDGSGFIMMALERAGGYYFNTGGSDKIISGKIKVKAGEIASFSGDQVVFRDESTDKFDVVVFATGYTGFPDTVRMTIGEEWANRFNPVWGLDEEGEIRGVARESGVPNFYFLVGNLSAARISSKVLALQIKAQQLGIFPERYTIAAQQGSRAHTNGSV